MKLKANEEELRINLRLKREEEKVKSRISSVIPLDCDLIIQLSVDISRAGRNFNWIKRGRERKIHIMH